MSPLFFAMLVLMATDSCDLPPGYVNYASKTSADLKFTFGVEKFEYTEGETINLCYVVENVGTEPVTVSEMNIPQWCFALYADTCFALDQPGCYETSFYFWPDGFWSYEDWFTLDPGECENDDYLPALILPVAPGPGSYRLFGGLLNTSSWPLRYKLDSQLILEISVATPTGIREDDETTWGRIKALFQ